MEDELIFDEHDELDCMLICSPDTSLEEKCLLSVSLLEDYTEDDSIDCIDIDSDEADVSPIGMEAEEIIDADNELFLGDEEDNELIDIVGGL